MTVFDFNSVVHLSHSFCHNAWQGMAHERWPNRLRATLRLLAQARIQQVHPSLPRPSTTAKVLLPRPVSLHGFCSTHLPGQLARYRNVPASHVRQFVSRWFSRQGFTQYLGRRQRAPRLAHLQRLRPRPHRPCPEALCQRCLRRRSGSTGLRLRFDDHRSLSFVVSLGQVSPTQGSRQAAHADRSARQYPLFYPHHGRQNQRCQCPRRAGARTRRFLHDGSRLRRFPSVTPLHREPGRSLSFAPNATWITRVVPVVVSTRARACAATRRLCCKVQKTSLQYPVPLRRISYHDADTDKRFVFLTNNFLLPAIVMVQPELENRQVRVSD